MQGSLLQSSRDWNTLCPEARHTETQQERWYLSAWGSFDSFLRPVRSWWKPIKELSGGWLGKDLSQVQAGGKIQTKSERCLFPLTPNPVSSRFSSLIIFPQFQTTLLHKISSVISLFPLKYSAHSPISIEYSLKFSLCQVRLFSLIKKLKVRGLESERSGMAKFITRKPCYLLIFLCGLFLDMWHLICLR